MLTSTTPDGASARAAERAAAHANAARRAASPVRVPRRLATPALLLTAAAVISGTAPQTVGAKPLARPDLGLAAVQTAPTVSPGGALPMRVTVSISARVKHAASIGVYLSRDGKRSGDDVRLATSATTPKAGAKLVTKVATTVVVPATQPLGAVRLIACVDDPSKIKEAKETNNCRAAKAGVNVVAKPAEAQSHATPQSLIDADVAAGNVSRERGLVLRVFAAFGDARLPAKYAVATGAGHDDHGVMREVASTWASLSKAARKQVAPFFMPPPLRDGLAAGHGKPNTALTAKGNGGKGKRSGAEDLGTRAADEPADEQPAPEVCARTVENSKTGWRSVGAAGGKLRVWWKNDRPEDGKLAPALVADLGKAYTRYAAILGREPRSDAKIKCFNGGGGAVDIYLDRVQWKAGAAIPATMSTTNSPDCEGYPGFVVANADRYSSFSGRFTLAHELFHVFQMSYRYSAGCKDATWLDEGSATWAAHDVFPDDQSEHVFNNNLLFQDSDLTLGDYASWPLFLWMQKTLGDSSIRRTYEALPKADALHAADAGLGTWRTKFLDFARHGWNQHPYPSFTGWDKIAEKPRGLYQKVTPVHLFLAGQKQRTAYAEFSLSARARHYKPYQLTDEKLREITFRNTLAKEPDARIGAILTLADGSTRFEDWSGKERVTLCRDEPTQNVTELVLVYANSKLAEPFADGNGIKGTPELGLRDSCADLPWHYEILWGQLKTNIDAWRPGNAEQGLCVLDGFETRDRVTFVAAADGQGFKPGENQVKLGYDKQELEGEFSIRAADAYWDHDLVGCMGWDDAGPRRKCTATKHQKSGSGKDVGFSLSAPSKRAPAATLRWWLPPAIAGFVDSDDSVCNVFTMDRSVNVDGTEAHLIESEVPMSTLGGTEPFTVTKTGTRTWNADQYGEPAVIGYSWEFQMRLQRVNEDGSPL